MNYQVEGFAIAKDEIDRALDVAIHEEMSPPIIQQRVLKSYEPAVVERCLVS